MGCKIRIIMNPDDGEAALVVGDRFHDLPLVTRLDIVSDLAHDLEALQLQLMRESGNLGEVEACRLEDNRTRRNLCTRLQGARIEHAEALPNGHIALALQDGTNLALYGGEAGDVIVEEVESMDMIQAIAKAESAHSTRFTEELPQHNARH